MSFTQHQTCSLSSRQWFRLYIWFSALLVRDGSFTTATSSAKMTRNDREKTPKPPNKHSKDDDESTQSAPVSRRGSNITVTPTKPNLLHTIQFKLQNQTISQFLSASDWAQGKNKIPVKPNNEWDFSTLEILAKLLNVARNKAQRDDMVGMFRTRWMRRLMGVPGRSVGETGIAKERSVREDLQEVYEVLKKRPEEEKDKRLSVDGLSTNEIDEESPTRERTRGPVRPAERAANQSGRASPKRARDTLNLDLEDDDLDDERDDLGDRHTGSGAERNGKRRKNSDSSDSSSELSDAPPTYPSPSTSDNFAEKRAMALAAIYYNWQIKDLSSQGLLNAHLRAHSADTQMSYELIERYYKLSKKTVGRWYGEHGVRQLLHDQLANFTRYSLGNIDKAIGFMEKEIGKLSGAPGAGADDLTVMMTTEGMDGDGGAGGGGEGDKSKDTTPNAAPDEEDDTDDATKDARRRVKAVKETECGFHIAITDLVTDTMRSQFKHPDEAVEWDVDVLEDLYEIVRLMIPLELKEEDIRALLQTEWAKRKEKSGDTKELTTVDTTAVRDELRSRVDDIEKQTAEKAVTTDHPPDANLSNEKALEKYKKYPEQARRDIMRRNQRLRSQQPRGASGAQAIRPSKAVQSVNLAITRALNSIRVADARAERARNRQINGVTHGGVGDPVHEQEDGDAQKAIDDARLAAEEAKAEVARLRQNKWRLENGDNAD
jgi:hypothetical protein